MCVYMCVCDVRTSHTLTWTVWMWMLWDFFFLLFKTICVVACACVWEHGTRREPSYLAAASVNFGCHRPPFPEPHFLHLSSLSAAMTNAADTTVRSCTGNVRLRFYECYFFSLPLLFWVIADAVWFKPKLDRYSFRYNRVDKYFHILYFC